MIEITDPPAAMRSAKNSTYLSSEVMSTNSGARTVPAEIQPN